MLDRLKRNDLRRRLGEFKDQDLIRELLDTCDAVEKKEVIHVVLNHKGQVDVWSTGRCTVKIHELAPDQQFDDSKLPVEYGLQPTEIGNPRSQTMEQFYDYSMDTLLAAGKSRLRALESTLSAIARQYRIPQRELNPQQTAYQIVTEDALAEAKRAAAAAEAESEAYD